MPNHPAVTGAMVVASIAVAAAITIYESAQARQFAEDVRRKIAMALHSLGDEINPSSREPRFNRPEDAEGFFQSQGAADLGVEVDEESRRRQREELMYWNAVKLENEVKERKFQGDLSTSRTQGSSFENFLRPDQNAEKGTYVYNTGADVGQESLENLQNRRVRGFKHGFVFANPFSDQHNIDTMDASLISPEASEKYEMASDIYAASDRETTVTVAEPLVDFSDSFPDPPTSYPTREVEEVMMAGSTDSTNTAPRENSPFASIQAWAQSANTNSSYCYTPLPISPRPTTPQQEHQVTPISPIFSDPGISVPQNGDITPTDSVSEVGSTEQVWAPRSGATSEAPDVMSVDGDHFSSAGTWSEVESVVSEHDISRVDQ